MSLFDITNLSKDEQAAKNVIDYATAAVGKMLDEKIDRLEALVKQAATMKIGFVE